MGGTDGIGPHLFQQFNLMAQRRAVDGRSQRSQVVVVADAFELCGLSVQKEALFGYIVQRPDTEPGFIAVYFLSVYSQGGACRVQGRMFRTPQVGLLHAKGLGIDLSSGVVGSVVTGHFMSVGIGQHGQHLDGLAVGSSFYFEGELYRGLFTADCGGSHVRAPHGNVHPMSVDHMHVAVDACSGIPARLPFLVFTTHFQLIGARYGDAVDVHIKGIVAIGPIGYLLSVAAYAGMAHHSVEDQSDGARRGVGYFERSTIDSLSDEGQAAGASGLFGGFLLAVLCYGHHLQVVFAVERTVDSPVVGHADGLAVGGVKSVAAAELPAFL